MQLMSRSDQKQSWIFIQGPFSCPILAKTGMTQQILVKLPDIKD